MKGLAPKQKDYFYACVKKWQIKLNLGDWVINYPKSKAQKDAMADVDCDRVNRMVSIRLGSNGWSGADDHRIEGTAVHELLHVRLRDLVELAKDPNTSEDTLMASEHQVVVVLEALLLPKPEQGGSNANTCTQ